MNVETTDNGGRGRCLRTNYYRRRWATSVLRSRNDKGPALQRGLCHLAL
jgi:hypothetical protein